MDLVQTNEVLVLGIGNILWADEGFGVRAVELFHKKYLEHPKIKVMDGGTLGIYLMNDIISSKKIILFDCCELNEAPGTLKVLRNEDIKLWSNTKISPHQTGMNDVLATAYLEGYEPEAITVIGIQPFELNDYGGSLSEVVKAQLEHSVELAQNEIQRWGYALEPRLNQEDIESLSSDALKINPYETERPTEIQACRHGDVRFIKVIGQ